MERLSLSAHIAIKWRSNNFPLQFEKYSSLSLSLMASARKALRHIVFGVDRAMAAGFHPRFNIPATSSSRCIAKQTMNTSNPSESLSFRRFSQSTTSTESMTVRFTDQLIQRLGSLTIKDRIHLEGLAPPLPDIPLPRIAVEDARKLLHDTRMQALRSSLRSIPKDCISYDEFLSVCEECVGGSNPESAKDLAKKMDESGSVIVLGDNVYLHPDQVARALERVMPRMWCSAEESQRREVLAAMEKEKAEIDATAARGVRRELWCGLGYLVVQTTAFMRLTFWELSWDVMEPICFYVTSFYFIAGYAFFLHTSRDPSFEGFFASRFDAKQRRLIRRQNFDLDRFHYLRRSLRSFASSSSSPSSGPSASISHSLIDNGGRR